MKHIASLAVKGLVTLGVLWFILPSFARVTGSHVLYITLVLGVIGYLVDLTLLPAGGNLVATVADFLTATGVIWLTQFVLPGMAIPFSAALIAGLAVAGFEWFFHRFLKTFDVINWRDTIKNPNP